MGPPGGKDTKPHQSSNCDQRCRITRTTKGADGITRRFINIIHFYNVYWKGYFNQSQYFHNYVVFFTGKADLT